MTEVEASSELNEALARLAVSKNDESAWRTIYGKLWPLVFATAYRRLKDRSSAEDAAQEVFVRLLHSDPFKQLKDADELRAYVWRAAINAANSTFDKSRRISRGEHALHELGQPELAEDAATDDRLLYGEALGLAKARLPPEDVKLLGILIAGGNLKEAAEILGLSYSNTGVRLHRLRAKLHNILNLHVKKIPTSM
jgi:RNA polymerase sigma factor (sigma-70 family)